MSERNNAREEAGIGMVGALEKEYKERIVDEIAKRLNLTNRLEVHGSRRSS